MANKQRDRLINLFTFEKPHCLRYARLRQEHKKDREELSKMISEGIVKVIEKDRKFITYMYTPNS